MFGEAPIIVIGVKSENSYGSLMWKYGLSAWPAATMISVYPSAGDFTKACEAITPPAPGRLSMRTDWFQRRETSSPSVRAMMSTAPPGGNGTRMRTGWDGKFCAAADVAAIAR